MRGRAEEGGKPTRPGKPATLRDRLQQAERRLHEVEERYALSTSAALEGIYEWDLAAGTLSLTERAKEFFALFGDDLTAAAWNARIHTDDYSGYRAAIISHIKGRTPRLEHEYRIVDKAGGYKWILDRGVAVRNATGRVTKVVGALSDITQRKLAEIEVRRARDQAEEALEQQTAMSEILRVMARSPTDTKPVFDLVAQRAVKLCDAEVAVVSRFDGKLIELAAIHGLVPEAVRIVRSLFPMEIGAQSFSARAIRGAAVIHIADVLADRAYPLKDFARAANFRSGLAVPIVRDRKVVGSIFVGRATPGLFADSRIDLLKAFADQAAIAIENVRLFNETKEALEQQTASSEILRVISRSPTDVQPAFETIATSALKLCGASTALVTTFDGKLIRVASLAKLKPEGTDGIRNAFPRPPGRDTANSRAILTGGLVEIPDVLEDSEYATRVQALAGDFRSILAVPLMRAETPLGAISVGRPEPGRFPETQIALLKTFADQAVMAIENVRLFHETKEALDQQRATSEILGVISSSPTNVQPVFDAIVRSAVQLCGAEHCLIFQFDGEFLWPGANYGISPGFSEYWKQNPFRPGPGTITGRAAASRRTVHVLDVLAEPGYEHPEAQKMEQYRTVLSVPMLKEETLVGVITAWKTKVEPFTDKQVELVDTFADQAVIAIENVRLFKELEARTQELTRSVGELKALGEVGQAVSSTLDLETVLATIVSRATQLAGMDGGSIWEYDEAREEFHLHATDRLPAELVEALRATPIRKGEGALGRLAMTGEPVEIRDIADERSYQSRVREILLRSGYRAVLAVPLLREDRLLGALAVIRKRTGEFAPEVIELLKTFATQSALAIQNARLFREIEAKSRQLEVASQHKSEFLANMSHELRTPLNAIIGFSEVLAERLFGEINEKQADYLGDILESGRHLLSLINDILDLSKIEAGRMELEPTEFDLPGAIENTLILVRERAQRHGITLGRTVDERLGRIRADERKVKQVLLNLLSNALKFTPAGGRIDVRAAVQDGAAAISVTDTGVGIAPEDQAAVFEEFRQVGTAAKKVEGTGLGLAISRKFVELHGGRIWVESTVGAGSTFAFTLPLTCDHEAHPA